MKNLILAVTVFLTLNCFAQPGDLSFPTAKNRVYRVISASSLGKEKPVITIYDGLTLNSDYILKTIDANSINSVKISKDSIFDAEHVLKSQGMIEIATKDEVNPGLKYINTNSNYWTKNYPLAVYYLNGKILPDDAEKLDALQNIKVSSIKQIRALDFRQGKELLGDAGKNGVILIDTN